MAQAPHPRMHGLTHVPGGSDPIPGLPDARGTSLDDLILAVAPDAFWKLDETAGLIAHDSSGNSHDLTSATGSGFTPPTWGQTAGPPGTTSAKWVDATTRESASTMSAFTDNFTAGVWVNLLTLASGEVIGQGQPVHASPGWAIMSLPESSIHKWAVQVYGHTSFANNPLTINTWYFVAAVRDAGTWKLYVNGLLQAATITDSPGTGYGTNTWLGNDAYASHSNFLQNALLSYAFIANQVLSGTELLAMYDAAVSGGALDSGLVWTADGAGAASWQPSTIQVDGTPYQEILAGTGLTSTDNTDGTVTLDAAGGGGFDPATATTWWFPLVDSDGTCVLDSSGALIPTLIPL